MGTSPPGMARPRPERFTIEVDADLTNGSWHALPDGVEGPLTAASLSDLKRLINASTAARLHVLPARVDIQLSPRMPDEHAELWAHSQEQDHIARAAAADAAATRRTVIRNLAADGVSGPDIATLLHLSPGRIHQLLREDRKPPQDLGEGTTL